jgi:hypothetical protein
VTNWSISRNYKNIWKSTKDSVTTGMFVTRRPCRAKLRVKGAQGAASRPHFKSVQAETDGCIPKSVNKSVPCSRVGGDREEWPAGHTLLVVLHL